MPRVSAHLLPDLLQGEDLTGSVAVIIDILRASTTIVHALANGARAVSPHLHVEDVQHVTSHLDRATYLMGGERQGERIPGFDLDNSPFGYTRDVVAGKIIFFTTTNGTKALLRCQSADRILIGAFVNLSALLRTLSQQDRDVHLVCAGTNNELTAEDILFAGTVLEQLLQDNDAGDSRWELGNEQGRLALQFLQQKAATPKDFQETFYASLGARRLKELGLTADIDRAMQRDLFDFVPEWSADRQLIVLPEAESS